MPLLGRQVKGTMLKYYVYLLKSGYAQRMCANGGKYGYI